METIIFEAFRNHRFDGSFVFWTTWPDLGFSGSPTPSGRAEDQVGERSPKSSLSAHGQGQKVPATWAWIAGMGGWIGIKKSLDIHNDLMHG